MSDINFTKDFQMVHFYCQQASQHLTKALSDPTDRLAIDDGFEAVDEAHAILDKVRCRIVEAERMVIPAGEPVITVKQSIHLRELVESNAYDVAEVSTALNNMLQIHYHYMRQKGAIP